MLGWDIYKDNILKISVYNTMFYRSTFLQK